jgi:hypothetical protein
MGKDVEGSGGGLIGGTIPEFAWRAGLEKPQKPLIRILGFRRRSEPGTS